MTRQKQIGKDVDGSRVKLGSDWYELRMFEYISDKEWTMLYNPDDPGVSDVFYLYSRCGCGQIQLRMIIGYPMFVTPGRGRANFQMHELGEGLTRTPSLNVLRSDTIIKGQLWIKK